MKKILWVDDGASVIHDLVKPIIRSGIDVEIVESRTDALTKLEGGKVFDAFIVHLILPSGLEKKPENIVEYLGVSLVNEIKVRWPKAKVFVLACVMDDAVLNTVK